MTTHIAIIDSGGANIASLTYALDRLGASSVLTADAAVITAASHVILPGVGAAADAMQTVREGGLAACIRALTQPVLGICLGMQLLAESSDEGDVECLGVMPGAVQRLQGSPDAPVPNMGWSPVQFTAMHPLFDGIPDGSHFYFLHSYALPVNGSTLATARHSAALTAIAGQGNFLATQFHPERSSTAGARLLANFLTLES